MTIKVAAYLQVGETDMKRFKNILIVCDETERLDGVLKRGLWLAKANDARVTLIDVVETKPGDLSRHFSALPPTRAAEIERQVMAHYSQRLSEHAKAFRSEGIEVREVVDQGIPFISVIQRVLSAGHDLVLKGDAPHHPAQSFFASNDMHLIRKCPCPVWILQSRQPRRTERILAAIDPDTTDPAMVALNRTILELAGSLAARDESELHIVHAWRLQEETALRRSRLSISEDEVAAILTAEGARLTGEMGILLAGLPEVRDAAKVAQIKGVAGDVIPDYAHEHNIDTIVMGTVGRTGVAGFFIGNTAETILGSVECSVLTVKPVEFRSPVGLPA